MIQLVTFQQMINKRAWFKYYLLELHMISGSVNSIIASTVDMLLWTRGSAQLTARCRLTHYKSFTVTRIRAELSRGAVSSRVSSPRLTLSPAATILIRNKSGINYCLSNNASTSQPCCTQCFFKSILSGFWGGVLDLVKTHLKTNKNCVTSWEDWRWRCRCTLYLSIGSVMGWHISSHLRI